MFAEGSVYAAPGDDGIRCLVMRRWPRGVSYERVDVWLKELGPPPEHLHALDRGRMPWSAFAAAYVGYLRTNAKAREALAQLRSLEGSSGKVTLLCHEPAPPCHRFLLLDVLDGKL